MSTDQQPYVDVDAENRRQLLSALVAYRKQLGLSQEQVAAELGIAQQSVSAIERDAYNVSVTLVQRYARALGVELKIEVLWMCLGCNDYFGPDDDDVMPLCIMCLKCGPGGPRR